MTHSYARDASRKIKAVKKSKGMSGNYASSHPIYGYVKSEDKKQWLIDPVAADVVRWIFRMIIEGYGACQIATILQRDRVHSPAYHMAQMGMGTHKSTVFEDPFRWNGSTICTMLERQEYMGHMVNFKSNKPSFKDKKREAIPPEEWVIFENKHEPIIDPETWHTVNRIRQNAKRRRPDSLGEPHPLSGMLYCADCGSKMRNIRGIVKQTGKPRDSYTCDRSKFGRGFCTGHTIQASAVKTLVLETLRTVSQYASGNEDGFTQEIHEMFSARQAGNIKIQRKKLTTSRKRRDELDTLIQRIYEDSVAGRITDKRFEVLSAEYEREQAELEQTIAQIQDDIDSFDDSAQRAEQFLEPTRKYKDFSELTAPMLHEFVDKILIHERAVPRAKCTTQKVEIYLNFIGAYVPPIEPEEQPPEVVAEQERLEAKRLWQREYRKRRKANGDKPLGRPKGPKPDNRMPEQKVADEAAQKEHIKAYQKEWQRKRREAKAAEKEAAIAV